MATKNPSMEAYVGSLCTQASSLNGLDPGVIFQKGEEEVSTIPPTADEEADQA